MISLVEKHPSEALESSLGKNGRDQGDVDLAERSGT
jgi:hypothetical protein